MTASGMISVIFVSKPAIAQDNELITNGTNLCSRLNDSSLTVIAQSEWARYALYDCNNNPYYPLDRTVNSDLTLSVGDLNLAHNFVESCASRKLQLPNSFTASTAAVLVDNCFEFNQDNYYPSDQLTHFTIFHYSDQNLQE